VNVQLVKSTFVNKEQLCPLRSILAVKVNGGSATYAKSVFNAAIAVIGTECPARISSDGTRLLLSRADAVLVE